MVQANSSALLAGLAAVATARKCQNLTVPISITASNTHFKLQAPSNNVEVTDFVLNLAQPGANYTAEVLGDTPVSTFLPHPSKNWE